jgi:hypothetical protein
MDYKQLKDHPYLPNSNSWFGIATIIAGFIALIFAAKGIFWILSWIAPILFIAALIINYRVPMFYGKMLLDLVKSNPLAGIIVIGLSAAFFPIVAAALLGLTILNRKVVKKFSSLQNEVEKFKNQYTNTTAQDTPYEEVESKPKVILGKKDDKNPYDKFFGK